MNIILARLRTVIEHSGLSDSAFARRLDLPQSTFSNLYQRDSLPKADVIASIINEFNINSNWLLTGEGPMFLVPSSIGLRLKAAREEYGHTHDAMASFGGVTLNTYNKLESDREEPDGDFLRKIEGNLNIDSRWIMTGKGEMWTDRASSIAPVLSLQTERKEITYTDRDDIMMVPVLGQKVSAGPGQELLEATDTEMSVPILKNMISPYPIDSIRTIEVRGDSMTGVNIFDGDFVIFSQGEIRMDGIYVLAIGDELYVKRLEFDPLDKKITIISENPHYKDKVVSAESDLIRIEGKVIGWIHRHPY